MNKVILMGRLARDPEARTTTAGKTVASFTVATDRPKTRDGQKQPADFTRCIAFDKTASFVATYFKKGARILIEGRLQTRSYDRDGQKHYVTEVLTDRAEFCESKGGGQTANNDGWGTETQDSDIPF